MPLGTKTPRYVIITPVRNEAEHFESAISTLIHQTVRPVQWMIVDDGSTDGTSRIADQYAAQYPWITVVHRSDRGFRQPGTGVIEAFYDGLAQLREIEWDYLVKLDGDLSLEPNYFEECFKRFTELPQLGIGGGTVFHFANGVPRVESAPPFHVRGATKIYRRECWEVIGGLLKAPGWDTIDEVKANMLGWKTETFPNLRVLQYKATGSADGVWRDAIKNGLANYVTGYHPLFMLLKCVKRLFQRPYVVYALGLFAGFCSGYVKSVTRVDDPHLIEYLRRQQLRRLLLQESIWK